MIGGLCFLQPGRLLFVERKAAGVVEAKAEGTTLSGVAGQTGKSSVRWPRGRRTGAPSLPSGAGGWTASLSISM